MGGGIRNDRVYRTSLIDIDGWENAAKNEPGSFFEDALAVEFADLFQETEKSNANLKSSAFVSYDYETRDYTRAGRIDIKGSVTYSLDEDRGELTVFTGADIKHGGLNKQVRRNVCNDIHSKAMEAVEEYTGRKNNITVDRIMKR
jgi:hypothetical protein